MTQSLHPSASKGFSQSASLYQEVRPDYPSALVHYLKACLKTFDQPSCIDLGAGTGKFLATLLQVSPHILAVEPVSEMLEQLQKAYPHVKTLQAFSHDLKIPNQSIDAIFCAQSFHWFANMESLQEMQRILKPNGHLFFIWNQRDVSIDWVQALADLIYPLEGDTPRYHSGQWQQLMQKQNLFKLQDAPTWSYHHVGSVEKVVSKRLLSTSFIAALSTYEQQQLKLKFESIVQKFTGKIATDELAFPYMTHLYHYQKQS